MTFKEAKEKMIFGWDTSSLTNIGYDITQQREILKQIIIAPNLMEYVNLYEDIKAAEAVPLLSGTWDLASKSACGFSDNTQIKVSDVQLAVQRVGFDAQLCPNDLRGSAFRRYLPAGADEQELGFEEVLTSYITQVTARAIADLVLTGDTGSGDPINGFITQLYAASGVINVTGAAPTTSNALTLLFNIYENMSDETLQSDARPVIFVGLDWLRKAAIQSYNDNRMAYNFQIDDRNGFTLPTTNVRVQGFEALNGTNKALAGAGNYLLVGTDLEDDFSTINMWYSQDNRAIRVSVRMRLGAAIAFVTKFAKYTVTP